MAGRARPGSAEPEPPQVTGRAANPDWRTRALDRSELMRRSQERVLKTAEKLIAAARTLYSQSAGRDFTVQEVANVAGVSLQTFYRHFKSKDDLMLAVYESTVQESAEALRATCGSVEDPVERLRVCTVAGLRRGLKRHAGVHIWMVVTEHARLARTFPDEVVEAFRPYQNLLVECIELGVAQQVFRPGLPAADAAQVVATLVSGLYNSLGNRPAPHPETDQRLAAAWTFILSGLGASPVPPAEPRGAGSDDKVTGSG